MGNKPNNEKIIASIDGSLNGTGVIFGSITTGVTAYKFFSPLKSDHKNPNCVPVLKEYTSIDKLDNLIHFFLQNCSCLDLVVMESQSLYSSNASNEFKALYPIIQFLCRCLDIDILQVSPISLKLFATCDSKADKNKMVEYAKCKFDNIDWENISKKHSEDVADALHLFDVVCEYLKCTRLPAPKGFIDTCDIKYFETLPLHQQQVIAKLYNREDLYEQAVKLRNKIKKDKK